MPSSICRACVIVLLSTVHTSCLQGVRWASLLMSFPKRSVSNTRVPGDVPKSLLNRLQHREARKSLWGEGGGTGSSLMLSTPVPTTKAAFVGCTSGRSRLGSGGCARELSSPLAAHFDIPDDITPDAFWAALLTYSVDLSSSDALVMCQGAHTEASQAGKR